MSDSLEFTGERFTPECVREIWYEHYHRYALAARWCVGKVTLDAACGEGYGSAMLAVSAHSVKAIDISSQAIEHAQHRYSSVQNLTFQTANCISLPFDNNQFERVVSFETLEHLAEHDELLAEFRRVLKPDGILILSSPDKAVYSDQQNTSNEYHVKELYRDELEALISRHFDAWQLLGQKLMFHGAIWSLDGVSEVELDQVSDKSANRVTNGQHSSGQKQAITQAPMYFIALCAAEQNLLPQSDQKLWLFDDDDESVYQHYHGEIRRNMAAGGIIAQLEQEISDLKGQVSASGELHRSWWQRLFGKS